MRQDRFDNIQRHRKKKQINNHRKTKQTKNYSIYKIRKGNAYILFFALLLCMLIKD